jgi:hypothetical protein
MPPASDAIEEIHAVHMCRIVSQAEAGFVCRLEGTSPSESCGLQIRDTDGLEVPISAGAILQQPPHPSDENCEV